MGPNEVEFLPTFSFGIKEKIFISLNEKNLKLIHESDQSDEGADFGGDQIHIKYISWRIWKPLEIMMISFTLLT